MAKPRKRRPRSPFGQRLESAMAAKGVRDTPLGAYVGISAEAVKRLRLGFSKEPSAPTLLRIARILDIDPFWLYFGDEPASTEPAPKAARAEDGSEQNLPVGLETLIDRKLTEFGQAFGRQILSEVSKVTDSIALGGKALAEHEAQKDSTRSKTSSPRGRRQNVERPS